MPLITYLCECGNTERKFFRRAQEAPDRLSCEKCQKELKKMLSSPSSSSKIVVDNGHQARAVEIIPDIIEINQKRSEKDYRQD
jgi:hypothetical protein